MFTRVTKKYTIKDIEQADTETLLNLSHKVQKPYNFRIADLIKAFLVTDYVDGDVVSQFGKPNVTMKGYESNPGVWVFEHKQYGVQLFIFSDGHKKNCFKGTSYEFSFSHDLNGQELVDLICDVFRLVNPKIQDFWLDKKHWEKDVQLVKDVLKGKQVKTTERDGLLKQIISNLKS